MIALLMYDLPRAGSLTIARHTRSWIDSGFSNASASRRFDCRVSSRSSPPCASTITERERPRARDRVRRRRARAARAEGERLRLQ